MTPLRRATLLGGAARKRVWSPLDLGASLLDMLDAERPGDITLSGSAVTAWATAKSGSSFVQATGASRPIYSASSFNSRPGVTFDGSDDNLTLTGVGNLPTGANAVEIWALVDQVALVGDVTNRRLFGYGGDAASNTRELLRFNSSGAERYVSNIGNGSTTVAADKPPASGRGVIRVQSGPTATQVDVNGSTGSSFAVVPAIATTRARLGSNSLISPTSFFQGVVSFLAWTQPLTAPQAAQMTAYLKARGGIP